MNPAKIDPVREVLVKSTIDIHEQCAIVVCTPRIGTIGRALDTDGLTLLSGMKNVSCTMVPVLLLVFLNHAESVSSWTMYSNTGDVGISR